MKQKSTNIIICPNSTELPYRSEQNENTHGLNKMLKNLEKKYERRRLDRKIDKKKKRKRREIKMKRNVKQKKQRRFGKQMKKRSRNFNERVRKEKNRKR